MKILILNGPNLNLLGTREPKTYGTDSFDEFFKEIKSSYKSCSLAYFQSNIEGELIDKLHEVGFSYDGIVLNAGGYTHTSVSIGDAIAAITTPVVEVHISNVYAREDFRHQSFMAKHCKGVIAGFGMESYRMAIQSLLD